MTLRSILIVDDEENQRLVVEQALRTLELGWVITSVPSGHEALVSIAHNAPDLIITDYNMPFMNGLELIAQVRRQHVTSRVILMTAYSSPELQVMAQRLHIDYYLAKPVPLIDLRRLAASALG